MRRLHRVVSATAALLLVLPLAAAADAGSESPWARHKAGSVVKVKTTTKLRNETMVSEMKYTLLAVTAEACTLKIETSMGGNALSSHEVIIPVKAAEEEGWTWSDGAAEDLDVGGTKLKCRVRTGTSPDGGSTRKTWTAEVGGAPLEVKSELRVTTAGAVRTETRAVKRLDEAVKVGEREVRCWVRESVFESDGQRTETTVWESRDMPGGAVRSESKTTAGATVMTTVREVVEFEAK